MSQTGDLTSGAHEDRQEDEYYRATAEEEDDCVAESIYPGMLFPTLPRSYKQHQLTSVNHPTDITRPHTPISPYFTLSRLSTTTLSSTKVDQYDNDEASWPEQSSTTASRPYPHSAPHSPVCCPESASLAQTKVSSSLPQTPRHLAHHTQDHDHNLPTPPLTPENTRQSSHPTLATALRLQIPDSANENETGVNRRVVKPNSYLEQYAEVRALFMGSSERGREEQEIMRKRDSRLARIGKKENAQM